MATIGNDWKQLATFGQKAGLRPPVDHSSMHGPNMATTLPAKPRIQVPYGFSEPLLTDSAAALEAAHGPQWVA